MARKFIIDTNSVIDLFKYYYFDKKSGAHINKKIIDFIILKIKKDEIIVIDKVDVELSKISSEYPDIRKEIGSKIVKTDFLSSEVLKLSVNHYIKDNEKYFDNDPNRIGVAMNKYENNDADLFLVAYSLFIKKSGDEEILITDETTNYRDYRKLLPKIPTICKVEEIRCENLPCLLFERYRKQLVFDLQVAPEVQNPTPKS